MSEDNIARMVEETEEDFRGIEKDLNEAISLMQEIKNDLEEGELALRRNVNSEGGIEAGADIKGALGRDIKEMEADIRKFHELIADINKRAEKFADLMGAWEGEYSSLKP